ncbi:dehydrogenase/reductase SDR family member 4-like isoform X1 [Amphiura filiformis]|uniref:dehydrogenase/reductase SDR family member 4-like isoform X1 n=1 Tax=Amphiura filiformis TaxID=82378 RepID=UPI003B211D45
MSFKTRLLQTFTRRQVSYTSIRMAGVQAVNAKRLQGKVAIVTASTEGIGFAIAKRLGQEGAHVVISSRKQVNVDKAVAELKAANISAWGQVCHVAKADDRQRLISETVSRHGGFDILVSNAAVNPVFGPILQVNEAQWDKIFDVNVKSTFFLTKECVPYLEKRKGSSVVFVSSIGGYRPFDLLGPYSVSKTTLLGLIPALAPQLYSLGIRINGIAPGIIKTKFSGALWSSESVQEQAVAGIPMRRLGEPDECAGAVAFLCSDDASYITGETVIMAGGSQARL